MLNESKVNKEPAVNEEYQEQEPMEGCCSTKGKDEGSHSCCRQQIDEESEHQCNCIEDAEAGSLEQKLAEAEAKQDEYLKAAQRLQADFDNYKRRNRNALAESYEAGTADTVEAFLPVLDNLDRAIDSLSSAGADDSIIKGIELVRRQFLDTLSKLNVEEIEAMGRPFDPELHNAVGQVEAAEGQEENTIALVLQKGYRMGERVIRYSMVQVAR